MDSEQAEMNKKKKRTNALLLLDQNNFESMALNILFDKIKQLRKISESHN